MQKRKTTEEKCQKRKTTGKRGLRPFNTHLRAFGTVRIYTYQVPSANSARGQMREVCKGRVPLMEVSAFFCRCSPEKGAEKFDFYRKWIQNHQNYPKMVTKSDQNASKSEPKRARDLQNGALRRGIDF